MQNTLHDTVYQQFVSKQVQRNNYQQITRENNGRVGQRLDK
jgi:hypothetical protein